MTVHRIYVDTEVLREFSKSYLTRRNVFDQVGKSIQYAIQTVIDHMPDYDGRMQRAARNDALDFNNRCQIFSKGFEEDSVLLLKTAEAFENVDGQTVKILEECQGITSDACYIDLYGDSGSDVKTTIETINNPDGSITTITSVRSTKPDGSVHEIVTIETKWILDEAAALNWNYGEQTMQSVILGLLGLASGPISALLSSALGAFSLGIAITKYDKYAEGDTVTNTITIETTYLPDGTPSSQEITNNTSIIDENGEEKFEDTTGIDSTGALK